jgi:hypothetical protein
MRRGRAILNWFFGEEARRSAEASPRRAPLLRLSRRQQIGLSVALLVMVAGVVMGLILRRMAQAELARIQTQVTEAANAEAWAWMRQDLALASRLVDPQARVEWQRWHLQYQQGRRRWAGAYARQAEIQVGEIQFLGGFWDRNEDRLLVEIQLLRPEVPSDRQFREYRLYREVDGVWLRTATDAALWGDPLTRTVGRFTLHYHQRDQAAVEAVAAILPEMDATLSAWLGHPTPPDQPLTIRVKPDNVGVSSPRFLRGEVTLLSPILSRGYLGHSPAQVLSWPVAQSLARWHVDHLTQDHPPLVQWSILYQASQNWLAHHANPLLADEPFPGDLAALRRYVDENGPPTLIDLQESREVSYLWATEWTLIAAEQLIADYIQRRDPTLFPALYQAMHQGLSWEALGER